MVNLTCLQYSMISQPMIKRTVWKATWSSTNSEAISFFRGSVGMDRVLGNMISIFGILSYFLFVQHTYTYSLGALYSIYGIFLQKKSM